MNKQLTQMARERAVLLEKHSNLDQNQKDLIKNYEQENLQLREMNEQLNQSLNSDKSAIHQEVEKWRNQYIEMEKQYQDAVNNYDKDSCLWENKFKFLEQQRDLAKKEQEEQ